MKKMKKTLAMILTLCMIMTALGTCAFADGGYQIQVVDEAGAAQLHHGFFLGPILRESLHGVA